MKFNADLIFFSYFSQSKTAGATFLYMTDHEFSGIVYDAHTNILFANMYVYGYKKEKLPDGYESIFPLPNIAELENALNNAMFDPNEEIILKGSRTRENSTRKMSTSGCHFGPFQNWTTIFGLVMVLFRNFRIL